jgi:hypothetical protein
MEGSGVEREATRQLLLEAVEIALPLSGQDAEEFEGLLRRPENEGIRHTIKTWTETQQEIGRKIKAQQALLRVLAIRFGPVPPVVEECVRQVDDEATLDGLLACAITAATLADTGLL